MSNVAELTDFILDYVNGDREMRYAISITGEWGSGKTRYIERTLKEALKAEGKGLVRVSLFGISDSRGFFDRFVYEILSSRGEALVGDSDEDGEGNNLVRKGEQRGLMKVLGGTVLSVVQNKLKDAGLTYQPGSETLAGMLLQRDRLIVLDDVERAADSFSGNELFGIVNNFVENNGCKVVLVAKDHKSINNEILEKLVWKSCKFCPEPKELAKDILCGAECPHEEIGFHDVVLQAAVEVECRNARAMLKAKPLFEMLGRSTVLGNADFVLVNRKQTLLELMKYALQTPMQNEPKKPEEEDGESDEEAFLRIVRMGEYERYRDAFAIRDYFAADRFVMQEDVDRMVLEYLAKHYPESEGAKKMKRALDALRNIRVLDDDELGQALSDAGQCLRSCDFEINDLLSAVKLQNQYRSFEFSEAMPLEELRECAIKMVANDPEGAYGTFHDEYSAWARYGNYRDDPLLPEIDDFVVSEYERYLTKETIEVIDTDDPQCGVKLAERLGEYASRGYGFSSVGNRVFLDCFLKGDAVSQRALGVFFHDQQRHRASSGVDCEQERIWVKGLLDLIEECEPKSKSGKVRLQWLKNDAEELLKCYRVPDGEVIEEDSR